MKLLVFFFVFLFLPFNSFAHPGRLDDKGCHEVTDDWQYADGRTLKAGTEHCHRGLGAMALDGKEMLQDNADPGKSVKEIKTQAHREACLKAALPVLREAERLMTRVQSNDTVLTKEFISVGKRAGKIVKECGLN